MALPTAEGECHGHVLTPIDGLGGLVDEGRLTVDIGGGVDGTQASAEFQEWLDVQSRFHDYSYRNTLLIKRQYPEASRVAGYRTWQEEFDRHVKEGESAISI